VNRHSGKKLFASGERLGTLGYKKSFGHVIRVVVYLGLALTIIHAIWCVYDFTLGLVVVRRDMRGGFYAMISVCILWQGDDAGSSYHRM